MYFLRRDRALTESYGLFLLIILIGIAAIIILIVSGSFATFLLQKPPVFAVQAKILVPVPGKSVISLYHMQGDPVTLADPLGPDTSPGVFISLESPGGEKIAVTPSPSLAGTTWTDGETLTIYSDGSHFWVTGTTSAAIAGNKAGGITGISPGIWVIYITDRQTRVVVNSLAVTA